jgi:hypothetical protein
MAIVNSFVKANVSIPIIDEVIIMWPVDEMGRNSVMPSIMARIRA